MKSARCNEQHVIGFDRSMLCRHRCPFNQRQEIAVRLRATHIGSAAHFRPRTNLVDLIDKTMPLFSTSFKASRTDLYIAIQKIIRFF